MSQGLPNINIAFRSEAVASIARMAKGIVAVIVRDAMVAQPDTPSFYALGSVLELPTALGQINRDFVSQAFLGYVSQPRRVLLYVLPDDAADISDALTFLVTQVFDYLVCPPDVSPADVALAVAWIKAERQNHNAIYKAVLPNAAADHEAIVNFTTEGIEVGDKTYTAAGYCSRIAGLLAGTPIAISATFATLPEVRNVVRLTQDEGDAAVDAGEFILIHDGQKVKTGRAVNSLQTLTADHGAPFQKIKIVEIVDIIQHDLRRAIADNYIGKRSNSYDNKLVLVTAIQVYFDQMERDDVLGRNTSEVDIDTAEQELYLRSIGVDTSDMTAQQIREANTGSEVFILSNISILDAMEDVSVVVNI